jgi:hypothetical protein
MAALRCPLAPTLALPLSQCCRSREARSIGGSPRFPLDSEGEAFFPMGSFPFLGASASDPTETSIWPQAWVPPARAITRSPCSITGECCARPALSTTPS